MSITAYAYEFLASDLLSFTWADIIYSKESLPFHSMKKGYHRSCDGGIGPPT